ncbi:MAG TPA: glycine betaine ABC transporter substrate-binding protein [Clostridia bacterium]|nr:glycine betaine ABC transporter substrate-binding protein [Clostridia bacterium]
MGYTLISIIVILLLSVGCTESSSAKSTSDNSELKEPVKLVYVDWASELASAHVVKAVIEEKLDRECQLLSVSLIAMWESIAAGDQDATVAAWLPSLQSRFLEEHRSEVQDLGPNLEGTKIGLVVPDYVNIDSITELESKADKFNNKIVGIDPHAGIMDKTAAALEAYKLENMKLVTGSGPTMTKILGKAIKEQRWIVVTGWTPHWKFAKYDLKYLQDPLGVYGEEESIHSIVRKGLREDMPKVHSFLDNFYWEPEDMQAVMLLAKNEDFSYQRAAQKWIQENEVLVDSWIEN